MVEMSPHYDINTELSNALEATAPPSGVAFLLCNLEGIGVLSRTEFEGPNE